MSRTGTKAGEERTRTGIQSGKSAKKRSVDTEGPTVPASSALSARETYVTAATTVDASPVSSRHDDASRARPDRRRTRARGDAVPRVSRLARAARAASLRDPRAPVPPRIRARRPPRAPRRSSRSGGGERRAVSARGQRERARGRVRRQRHVRPGGGAPVRAHRHGDTRLGRLSRVCDVRHEGGADAASEMQQRDKDFFGKK